LTGAFRGPSGVELLVGIGVEESRSRDVVEHRKMGEQVKVLKDKPDVLAAKTCETSITHCPDVFAPKKNFAFVSPIEATDDGEQRALARTTRPKHRDKLAIVHREVDVGQGATRTFARIMDTRYVFRTNGRFIHGSSKGRHFHTFTIDRRFGGLHADGCEVFSTQELILGQTKEPHEQCRRTQLDVALFQKKSRHLCCIGT